ncbi:MAG: helix-turn-helix domain-containing protein [Pseudomonadota bacterium]
MTEHTVKSVRRVFEILKLFDRTRRPLGAKEIARELGYPLTSTHALLKSMHKLGFADYDAATWSYVPSPSLPAIVEWVRDYLSRETQILDFMADLSGETRETINLSRPIGTQVRIVHGLETQHSVGVSVRVGTMMPIERSLTGIVALSCLAQEQQRDVLEEIRAASPDRPIDTGLIDSVGQELRRYGSAVRCDLFVAGIGAVCVPVRASDASTVMVVGVVGPSDRIMRNAVEYHRSCCALAEKHGVDSVYRLRTRSARSSRRVS